MRSDYIPCIEYVIDKIPLLESWEDNSAGTQRQARGQNKKKK